MKVCIPLAPERHSRRTADHRSVSATFLMNGIAVKRLLTVFLDGQDASGTDKNQNGICSHSLDQSVYIPMAASGALPTGERKGRDRWLLLASSGLIQP